MSNYGNLFEERGRQVLVFEREFPFSSDKVFSILTDSDYFTQWYPFATGEMDLRVGGKIKFDDGEGSLYEAVITEFNSPSTFNFQEVNDLLETSLTAADHGCTMTFRHTFDDREMAINTATGWHRCLDALGQLIHGRTPEWEQNAFELREFYKSNFQEN